MNKQNKERLDALKLANDIERHPSFPKGLLYKKEVGRQDRKRIDQGNHIVHPVQRLPSGTNQHNGRRKGKQTNRRESHRCDMDEGNNHGGFG
jgi:hypothetical protein